LRRSTIRDVQERGATASIDLWRGVTAQAGARLSAGADSDRWYVAGLSIPVANRAGVTLERTRTESHRRDSTAIGLQFPLGGVRIMQRYQWTDVALAPAPAATDRGSRQLQAIASYSPVRRIQLSYQLATQWSADTVAQQWTELQSVVKLSQSSSLHIVTGLPDVTSTDRFRVGLQQNLARGFRLTIDYGRLPVFQSAGQDGFPGQRRLLVTMRRTFSRATPAGGGIVEGRVLDQHGAPVTGARVTLGSYVTTAQSDGSYRFAHVPAGQFDLALDPAHLPVTYASDGVTHRLQLPSSTNLRRDLHAIPLHAIHGHVYMDRNGNAKFDSDEGVPNVVVSLGNQSATLTDQEGGYGFYDLLPNQYDLRVDPERLNRELSVVTGAIEVDLGNQGGPRTGVDFEVVSRQKPVIMQPSLRR
jgi:hypothetical protein